MCFYGHYIPFCLISCFSVLLFLRNLIFRFFDFVFRPNNFGPSTVLFWSLELYIVLLIVFHFEWDARLDVNFILFVGGV